MENKIIFYWNNKPDEEYHTHMWTNRICTEKLLNENINDTIININNSQFDPYLKYIENKLDYFKIIGNFETFTR